MVQRKARRTRAVRRKRCLWISVEQLPNSSRAWNCFLKDGEENAVCDLRWGDRMLSWTIADNPLWPHLNFSAPKLWKMRGKKDWLRQGLETKQHHPKGINSRKNSDIRIRNIYLWIWQNNQGSYQRIRTKDSSMWGITMVWQVVVHGE